MKITRYRGRLLMVEEVRGRTLTARPWSVARKEWRAADDFPLDSFDKLPDVTDKHADKVLAPQVG